MEDNSKGYGNSNVLKSTTYTAQADTSLQENRPASPAPFLKWAHKAKAANGGSKKI